MQDPIEAEEWTPVRRLNLNLLYPLDAILNAPSLTEAGRRVYLSQSAMSHALRRLREHFRDELVTYASGRQNLTTLGDALRPEIRRVLREVERAFDFSLEFDPGTSTREITIAASETVEHTFISILLRELMHDAQDVVLNMIPLNLAGPDSALARGADIIILPASAANPRFEHRLLYNETLACMVRKDHPILDADGRITAEAYAAGRHIGALADNSIAAPANAEGEELLANRRFTVRTSLQAAVPNLVCQSDLIATGSSSLFQSYAAMLPLVVTSAPFPAQEVPIVFQWSPHRRNDPMMRWLIDRLESSVPSHLQLGWADLPIRPENEPMQ
jgi:DNA-binding transcriptional LysR family regulator